MPIILPYDENIKQSGGAFVFKDDKIEYVGLGSHASLSFNYLYGEDYRLLLDLKYDDEDAFYDYKKSMNMDWKNRNDVNEFLSSALNEEEIELFLKYREEFEFERFDYCSDFMVEVFGIDKVSTVSNYRISTIKKQPHIYYFNYIIMGFDIDICCPMKFNIENDRFQYETAAVSYKEKLEDDEYKDKANEIIAKVPVKDRHLFFK